jgi:hypothetical protein
MWKLGSVFSQHLGVKTFGDLAGSTCALAHVADDLVIEGNDMSDTDTASSAPHRTQHGGASFSITVLNETFQGQPVVLHEPVVTGRQIAEAAGHRPADAAIVLQQLPSGAMEELRLDETVSLRARSIERFFVIVGDRTYRFFLDGHRIEWPREDVSAALLLQLAGRGSDHEILQEIDSQLDKLLAEDDVVSLAASATERFKTRRAPKTVTVYYNDHPVQIERGKYTTEQLLAFFQVEPGYILDLIRHGGEFVELKPGEVLQVREGQKFISHAPCGQSS